MSDYGESGLYSEDSWGYGESAMDRANLADGAFFVEETQDEGHSGNEPLSGAFRGALRRLGDTEHPTRLD